MDKSNFLIRGGKIVMVVEVHTGYIVVHFRCLGVMMTDDIS